MRKRILRNNPCTTSAEGLSAKITTASMKALPILVLLATSTMNPAPIAAQQRGQLAASQPRESVDRELINPVSDDTYTVVPSTQTPQAPQKKKSEQAFYIDKEVNNKYLSIVGVSTDSIKTSAEKMFLHYKDYNKNPDYEVKAKIFGYCPEPREDGRYIAIIGLVGDTELCVAAFPSEYKSVFDRSVMSEIRNNNAVQMYTMDEMKEMLDGSMDEIPGIEEFVPSEQQQPDRAGGTAFY